MERPGENVEHLALRVPPGFTFNVIHPRSLYAYDVLFTKVSVVEDEDAVEAVVVDDPEDL